MRFAALALLIVLPVFPAIAQTTAPTAALDNSTPRGALKLFFLADANRDGKLMRTLLQTSNPAEAKMADVIFAKKSADRDLTAALVEKFPDPLHPVMLSFSEAQMAPVFAKIDQTDLKENADTAKLSAPGEIAPPFTLYKSDNKWQIPLAVLLPNTDAAFLAEQSHQIDIQVGVMQEAASDVRSGKYATRDEATEAIKKRMFDVALADHTAAAGAATKPATQP